jgi:hypothetical protein
MEIASTDLFGMCGRCYDDDLQLFPANCNEKPEALAGAPLGQYHCPDCGAMVVAGLPHPPMCRVCIERKHPGFDMPNNVLTVSGGGREKTNGQ